MKKSSFFILLLILMSSCSPQKRITRLVKKHPHLIATYNTKANIRDTFYIENIKILPGKDYYFSVARDTTFIIQKDSIFVKGKNVRIVSPKDTIRFKDTVYLDKVYEIEGKAIITEPPWWQKFSVGFIVAVFAAAILVRIFK